MWTTIGHAPSLAALQRALASSRPPHAWLFAGPEGIGKAHVALEFAAALNCTEPQKPCGACRNCRDTLARRHPDVELVAPGGICDEPDHTPHTESRDLRICQVRRIEHLLALSPYEGQRRVAIVDAADTLHVEAANAFLKTLEEPPAESVIILLAEREERLPETVLSRCQRLPFRPIERDIILEELIERGASPETATTIAAAAAGRLGWAIDALEDDSLLQERDHMLDEARRLAHAGRAERFAWAREAAARDPAVRERYLRELALWETWWRDVLLYTARAGRASEAGKTNSSLSLSRERAGVRVNGRPEPAEGSSEPLSVDGEGLGRGEALDPTLLEEGKLYDARDIVTFLKSLAQTREYLHANVDPQLALENLTLDLPTAVRVKPRPASPARPGR